MLNNAYTNSGHGFVEVTLTNSDKKFLIDEDQVDIVQQCKSWSLNGGDHVRGWVDGKVIDIHRLLMQEEIKASTLAKPCIDHIDRDPLNNRKSNLRVVSCSTNNRSKAVSGRSRFPGIYFNKQANKWQAQIQLDGKQKHLGRYVDEMDAARAYRKMFKLADAIAEYEVWKELDEKPTQPSKQTNITAYFLSGSKLVNN